MATSAEIQTRLDAYRAAELRILEGGQESEASSGPDGRRTRRANLADIQKTIRQLEDDLAEALSKEGGGSRVVHAMPTW
jgi:hypothetical protein